MKTLTLGMTLLTCTNISYFEISVNVFLHVLYLCWLLEREDWYLTS